MIIQDDDWRTVLERISYLKREMASLEEMITDWPRKEIMSTGTKCQKCLKSRKTQKTSDREFKAALNAVRRLCKTSEEKKYFEEIRILAETRFKMRPLVTAVLRFTCKDPALAFSVKPAAVAELLETSLDSSFSKITRRDLDKAIEELNLQNSDLFEKSAGTQLGSFVKAQYIITGNIQKMSSQIVITARCIEVASGRIVKDSIFSHPATLPSAPRQSILSTDTTVLPLPETLNGTL